MQHRLLVGHQAGVEVSQIDGRHLFRFQLLRLGVRAERDRDQTDFAICVSDFQRSQIDIRRQRIETALRVDHDIESLRLSRFDFQFQATTISVELPGTDRATHRAHGQTFGNKHVQFTYLTLRSADVKTMTTIDHTGAW